MNNSTISAILDVLTQCDDAIVATCAGDFPDARHMTNALNRTATDLQLYFMTSRDTPKYKQLQENTHCALYYFNPANRHAVRLYGMMEFISDTDIRVKKWRPEFSKFGYGGPYDDAFVLMRFIPYSYKYYIGTDQKSGVL